MIFSLAHRGGVLAFLLLAGTITTAAPGAFRINEIMASNGDTLADEDGDFEDWVELLNTGLDVIDLSGWGFTDNPSQPYKWVFPAVTIDPGEFLIVWTSGKNRRSPGSPLHTGFSISAAGEDLQLTDRNGNVIDFVPAVEIPRDISFGRSPDGVGDFVFFNEPTPGAANTTPGFLGILKPPTFSIGGGFFTDPITLTLFAPDPEVQIIYTVDGSTPDPGDIGGRTFFYMQEFPSNPGSLPGPLIPSSVETFVYTEPRLIEDRTGT